MTQESKSAGHNGIENERVSETGETAEANGASEKQASASPLEEQLREPLERKLKESEQKYLYLYAEFENYKKRVIKERSELIKFGWENTARELLMVVDNLERALAHVTPGTDRNLMAGLEMVLGQFRSALEKGGVARIETVGKDFDPNLHEAVSQEASDLPQGKVVREELRGYLIHGRLLRPAKVVVSGGAANK